MVIDTFNRSERRSHYLRRSLHSQLLGVAVQASLVYHWFIEVEALLLSGGLALPCDYIGNTLANICGVVCHALQMAND